MRRLFALIALLPACVAAPDAPVGRPEVLGPEALPDLDPADDVVEYALEAEREPVELLPGVTTGMWTYNKMSPGPLL